MRKSKNLLIVSILVALITILVYLPALQNDFVNWDDGKYVYENPNIRSFGFNSLQWMLTTFHAGNWHPLTWLSHAIDYALWSLNPMGHHLMSVIFHGLNTFLVIILITHLINLTGKDKHNQKTSLIAGAITGLLFGLHPLHVESVAWVSERKDVLYAFFFLLSIYMYIKYVSAEQGRKVLFYGLCLGFFILSLMSKPMAVTLPVVLIILDFFPLGRLDFKSGLISKRKVLMEKVPFFGLSLASSAITIMAQQVGGAIKSINSIGIEDRMLIALRGLVSYLYKMLWPKDLSPIYPYPTKISFFMFEYIASVIFILVITLFCIYSWKKQKFWLSIWTYYLITLFPVLGIIQVGEQAAADRYTYLPSLGPFLLIGMGIARLTGRIIRKDHGLDFRNLFAIFAVAAGALVLLAGLTINQTKVWKDSETLWKRNLKLYPDTSFQAYNNLGLVYKSQGLIDEAIRRYKTAIQMNPNYPPAYNNLGNIFLSQGQNDKAIENFRIAIKLNPKYSEVHYNLGLAYGSKGLVDKAVAHYMISIRLNPNFPHPYNNLAIIYLSHGLLDKAENNYKKAISLKPEWEIPHFNLGNLYERRGDTEKARREFEKVLKINPQHQEARDLLDSISYRK
jgi:tetratricopeptide (TPR) repeat protein